MRIKSRYFRLFSVAICARYSAGDRSVICLKERLNERIVPKPTSSEISAIFLSVSLSSAHASLIRRLFDILVEVLT